LINILTDSSNLYFFSTIGVNNGLNYYTTYRSLAHSSDLNITSPIQLGNITAFNPI
ncbi:hypothetical protein V2W45_1199004, partial [Cenococcum geophilum]